MSSQEKSFIQIYILSRNRLASLQKTLESALSIQYSNFEVIVSDNSTNEEVSAGLSAHPQKEKFKFIRRPALPYFNQHINLIISEVQAPIFIIFHDDDLFLPNCLSAYSKLIEKYPDAGAYAGNTKMIYADKKSENIYFSLDQAEVQIQKDDVFLERYYGRSHGHPPFPFYLYRTEKVRNIPVNYYEGLIHSDGAFLFKIMRQTGLVWTSEVVGYYHLHATNISRFINRRALNSMYHFFLARTGDTQKIVWRYKNRNFLQYYIQNRKSIFKFLKSSRERKLMWKTAVFVMRNLDFYLGKILGRGQ